MFTSCFGGAIPRWQVWYSPDDCFSNFNFLSHQFFDWFCQRLNSLSTFCFDHFVPRLHNRTQQLFLFVLVLSHVIHLYILWWAIIYILTFFQILCNCVLVKFISFTAWVLTYSRLVGGHLNQHTHTRAHAPLRTQVFSNLHLNDCSYFVQIVGIL